MPEPEAPPTLPSRSSAVPVSIGAAAAGLVAGLLAGFAAFDRGKDIERLTGEVAWARQEGDDKIAASRSDFMRILDASKEETRKQLEGAKAEAEKARVQSEQSRDAILAKLEANASEHRAQVQKIEAELKKKPAETPRAPQAFALFNGQDLEGWEGVGGALDNWKVEGGNLICTGGKGAKWISTKEEFGDFELSLEYNLSEGGNSGLFIRTPRKGDPAYVGMELQIIDDLGYEEKHKAKLKEWQFTASIYAVVAPSKSAVKKAGEWNHIRVRAEGRLVSIWVNGQRVIDADTGGYAEGKPPLKERPIRGYIGLQNHGARLEFRNIQIKKLD